MTIVPASSPSAESIATTETALTPHDFDMLFEEFLSAPNGSEREALARLAAGYVLYCIA